MDLPNLPDLIEWTKKNQDVKTLREMVRRDHKGNPLETDVLVCQRYMIEMGKRAGLVIEHTQKAERFMQDISEYFGELKKRGVSYQHMAEVAAQKALEAVPPPFKKSQPQIPGKKPIGRPRKDSSSLGNLGAPDDSK